MIDPNQAPMAGTMPSAPPIPPVAGPPLPGGVGTPMAAAPPPPPIQTPAMDPPPKSAQPPKPDPNNRFVARALLYNELTDQQARRLAAATDQAPANTKDLAGDPAKVAAAWHFSPSANPAADFWALHDQTLQQNMAQVTPDSPPSVITAAHNDAETKALNAIYPYRAELMGLGTRVLEDQVAQADRIKKLVDNHLANQPAPVVAQPAQMLMPPAPPPPAPMAAPPPMMPPAAPMAPPPMPAPGPGGPF